MLDKMYNDNKKLDVIPVETAKNCVEKYTDVKEYKRQYYLKNIEIYRERNKQYRLRNKDIVKYNKEVEEYNKNID